MSKYVLFVAQVYSLSILRPLQCAILARGDDCRWFIVNDSAGRYLRSSEQRLMTVADVRAFASDAVFAPGNWVPHFFPGVKVQVFHGLETKERAHDHFRIRDMFDLYCTHGALTTPRFQELARQHRNFHVAETGWPKVDPLFDGSQTLAGNRGRPVILYASTFTKALTSAPAMVEEIGRLSRRGEWHWLVTLHPKMDARITARYRALAGPHLDFIETDDVIPLLKSADVMVSDTSSIVFEFLLLDRPVVTLRNLKPGPHLLDVADPAEVEGAIRVALERPERLIAEIRRFMDGVHPFRDGRSSVRVLDAVDDFIKHTRDRLGPRRLNLWRNLSIRKRLNYYAP